MTINRRPRKKEMTKGEAVSYLILGIAAYIALFLLVAGVFTVFLLLVFPPIGEWLNLPPLDWRAALSISLIILVGGRAFGR